MDNERLANALMTLLDAKKAMEVQLLDLRGRAAFTDFFLVASGASRTHVAALAEEVDRFAHAQKRPVRGKEGLPEATWVLLDLGDVVVHLFQQATREFYNLEKLWGRETLLLANREQAARADGP